MSNLPIIEVKNVSKAFWIPRERRNTIRESFVRIFRRNRYQKLDALHNISFQVKRGEFLGIIGRNGSGKSTLLKILAGIYAPDQGKIIVRGKISPFLELGVGFNPELTARENIYLNGTVLGLTRKELDQKLDQIIRFAELQRFVDTKLKNFSSGMHVRLAFSVAIQAQADIYLIDEVLAVGDANFQEKCFDVFREFKKQGKNVILITHALENVEEFCDRTILLEDGKIITDAKPEKAVLKYTVQNIQKQENQPAVVPAIAEAPINRCGNKKVIIKNIKITNAAGRHKQGFLSSEKLQIVLEFSHNESIDILNVGVGIYKYPDIYISGINTKNEKIKILPKTKRAILEIDTSQLLTGKYFVNIVCFGEIERRPYDWLRRAKEFKIISSQRNRGAFTIKHKWKTK